MNDYKDLKMYKRFISCNFNISYRWSELEKGINEFFEYEGEKTSENLLEEIHYIIELNDWEYIKKVNIETAHIYYEEERNKEMMSIIIGVLSKNLKDKVATADVPTRFKDSNEGW